MFIFKIVPCTDSPLLLSLQYDAQLPYYVIQPNYRIIIIDSLLFYFPWMNIEEWRCSSTYS